MNILILISHFSFIRLKIVIFFKIRHFFFLRIHQSLLSLFHISRSILIFLEIIFNFLLLIHLTSLLRINQYISNNKPRHSNKLTQKSLINLLLNLTIHHISQLFYHLLFLLILIKNVFFFILKLFNNFFHVLTSHICNKVPQTSHPFRIIGKRPFFIQKSLIINFRINTLKEKFLILLSQYQQSIQHSPLNILKIDLFLPLFLQKLRKITRIHFKF